MTTTEEILAKFLFLFLKNLSIELNNLAILTNHHHQLPKKSILRKSSDNKNLSLNQNNSNHRKILFTHIDSYEYDPQIPCRFLRQPERKEFYSSNNNHQMQCLCRHHQSKKNYQNKYKTKLKRQQK